MEISIETLKDIIKEVYNDGINEGESWGRKPKKSKDVIKEIFEEYNIKES